MLYTWTRENRKTWWSTWVSQVLKFWILLRFVSAVCKISFGNFPQLDQTVKNFVHFNTQQQKCAIFSVMSATGEPQLRRNFETILVLALSSGSLSWLVSIFSDHNNTDRQRIKKGFLNSINQTQRRKNRTKEKEAGLNMVAGLGLGTGKRYKKNF